MEHLFMQVFERRRWIEKQLRQQAESYSHSVAFNLVADGGRPPPWLLVSGSLASDQKELNREQLISEILCPLPSSTTPLVSNSSAFTLPIPRGDNLFKSISMGWCTSSNPAPPINTEHAFEVVINSKDGEACPELDPLSRIQRSRSRQRDVETRRGKRAKTMKDISQQNSAGKFTGRMTRSRAVASLKVDQVKDSSKVKNLLVARNDDGGRVSQSRSGVQKIVCIDQSSQLSKLVNSVQDSIQDVAELQVETHSMPDVTTGNVSAKSVGIVAPVECDAGSQVKQLVANAASPSHSGLRMTKAAAFQLSEVTSLVEPKQLLFEGIEEFTLLDYSAFASDKEAHRSLHQVALKRYEDFSVNQLVCPQSQGADQLSLEKKSQEELVGQTRRQLSGGMAEGRPKIANSECNSHPSYKGKRLQMLNPSSETEQDILEKEVASISPLGFEGFSSQVSERRVASGRYSPKFFAQYSTEETLKQKLINSSANDIGSRPLDINCMVQPKRPFHTNAECSVYEYSITASVDEDEDLFCDVNIRSLEAAHSASEELISCDSWRAHNSFSNKQFHKENILHAEEVMPSVEEDGTVSDGEPEAGRPGVFIVEDSECDSLPESCERKHQAEMFVGLMMKGTSPISETAPTYSSPIRDCLLTSGVNFEGRSAQSGNVSNSSSLVIVQHSAQDPCSAGLGKMSSNVLNSGSSKGTSWIEPMCLPSALIGKSDLTKLCSAGLEKEKMGNNPRVAVKVAEEAKLVNEESISRYSNKAEFSYPNNKLLKEQVLPTSEGRSSIKLRSTASKGQQEEERCGLLLKDESESVFHPSFCKNSGSSDKSASSSEIVSAICKNRLPCPSPTAADISAMGFLNGQSILPEHKFVSLQSEMDHVEVNFTKMVAEESTENTIQMTSTFDGYSSGLQSSETAEMLLEAGNSETAAVDVARNVTGKKDGAENRNSSQNVENLYSESCSLGRLNSYLEPPPNGSDDCLRFKNTVPDAITEQATENCVILTCPHADEVDRTTEARYFLRSSTSSSRKVGSIKTNGSLPPLPTENSITESISGRRQSVTPNYPGAQDGLTETRYFLRSLANQAKSLTSRSDELQVNKRFKRSMQDAAHEFETTWPKRKIKNGRSKDAFTTSPKLALRPLLNFLKENKETGRTTSGKASEILELQPFGSSNEMENEIGDIPYGKNTEELCKNKKQSLTKGDPNISREKKAVVTTLPNNITDAAPSLDRVLGGSESILEDHVEDIDSTAVLTFKEHNILNGAQDFGLMGNILEPESLHNVITQLTGPSCRNERFCATGPVRLALYNDDLAGCEESMPEFERFSIDISSSLEDDRTYNEVEVPNPPKVRASLLEQLCRSSILTPLSQPSAKYEITEVSDVYQSLTAGTQELMGTSNSIQCKYGDISQLSPKKDGSLSGIHSKLWPKLHGTFSGRLESSLSARSGCEARKPPLTPPVKKLARRISGKSCVSSERMDSNPELVCFRIDENSITTGENDNPEDASQGLFGCKELNVSTKRRPLTDVTSEYENAPFLVSESKKFTERGSIGSVNTVLHFEMQMDAYPTLGSKDVIDAISVNDKENSSLSVGKIVGRKAFESLCSGSSKPDIIEKGKEKTRSQTFLGKGGKPTNIVSNISSFIPLVRQKQQATAPVGGKRDIKVKALEAAEAARRLQERRQNERDMRKAAAKQERIKIEQEAAKQLELKQKQKEEAWKKKEADIAARKRQREDEEQKEKDRKRRCLEETRRQQKERVERLHPEKKERKLQNKAANESEGTRKAMAEDGMTQLKSEKGVRCEKAIESEPTSIKTVEVDGRYKNYHTVDTSDALKKANDCQKMVGSLDALQKPIQDRMSFTKGSKDLQSYEISPYKDSDDEDGEEDNRRKRKYIPSWARKECLDQILLSNQDVDPSEIFSRKSSFNLSEVLSPRMLRRPLSQI